MDEDFDFNETATAPATHQEFLMENLCFKAGKPQGSYTPPATRSASTRWKRLHEQSMMLRLDEMHVIKKQNAQLSKDAARKIIRKIPVEILAREWLSKEDATVDMRAFLVDQVLPTLILGVERLLKEVDEKGLSASNVYQTEFNPINFLAQYLMRNNPRFSNFAEASPYVRGLREVSEEIKQELFTFEDNRLARIKAEARRKRQEREKLEQQIREERDRRQQQLIVQFQEWNVPTDNNRVELSLLQNALRSFAEIAEQLPSELREVAKFGHALEPTDETGRTLAVKEFAQYISMFVEDLPIEVFEQFMVHMSKCAAAHRAAAERENRRIILTNLFLLCDHGGLGLLDRHRILSLFEQFWDLARETKEPKGTLRNPRKWPVIEVDEVDDIMFEAFEEEGDGGLTEHEAIVAAQQLSKVQTKLNKQAADSAVNDKAALEKWKMEQLSEKSEGMRKRLYRYGPRDFLNLVTNYSLRETLECPVVGLHMSALLLMEPHDMVALTLAVTKEERNLMFIKHIDSGMEEEADEPLQTGNHTPNEEAKDPAGKKAPEGPAQAEEPVDYSNALQSDSFVEMDVNTNRRSSSSASPSSAGDSGESRPNSPKFPGALRYKVLNQKGATATKKLKAVKQSKKRELRQRRSTASSDARAQKAETPREEALSYKQTSPNRPDQDTGAVPTSQDSTSPEFQISSRRRKKKTGLHQPTTSSTKYAQKTPSQSSTYSTKIRDSTTSLPPIGRAENIKSQTRRKVKFSQECKETDGGKEPERGFLPHVASGRTSFLAAMLNYAAAQEGDVDDKTVLGETEAETEAQQVEDAGQKKEEEEEPASEVTQAEETKDETAEQQGDAVDASTADSASAPAKDDAETKTDDSAEKKDAEKPESGEKASSVEKVEGETGTDDNTAAGQEEGTSGDVTINMAANGAKEAGETEKEQAQGEGEKEKDETEMGDEDLDVDITAELAGDGSKSALKRIDPVTGATATGRASVTFAGNTAFDRERTEASPSPEALTLKLLSLPCDKFRKLLLGEAGDSNINNRPVKNVKDDNANSCNRVRSVRITTNSRSQSQMSAFDESVLNVSQFVQLTETFLGHDPIHDLFTRLVHYLKEGYEETEEEKMERLVKARKEAISAKRKLLMDNLFEKWDNDGSGFLEMEDVQEVMFRYKDGQEIDSIKRAQTNMKRKSKYHDARLSKREFRQFVELVADELPGAESFESFVEFLTNSVERSYAERIRGEARKKWLSQIVKASQVSGTSLEPVYKAVFQALYKDAETHGGEKHISSSISMLERNTVEPARGDLLLRYAACTPEDCEYMLGKALFKNMKGISFQCVDSGKPIHVPRVANHGNVYFWNYDRMPDDREGSFMVCPLKDRKKRVFGLLGIDTLNDPHKKAIFITHEIQFFQGVAKAFSIAYHNVDMRKKLLRITESAISWIQRRCPHIAEINVYMVEPAKGGTPSEDGGEGTTGSGGAVLRKMMTTDKKGQALPITDIIRLERKDNLFRDYLFKCMDNSETVTADAYGERHTASPLRDNEGKAIGVVDISIGDMRRLPPYENKEAQRMLRLLQMAHREITKEADGDETTRVLEAEKDDAGRMDIMFDRLMLMELRENVARLDPQSFAELKSYHEPPRVIHDIIRAALAVFNVEKAGEGGYDDWNIAKTFINNDLVQQIKTYDPTVSAELIKSDVVEKFLKAVPHGEVGKYGSIPAQQLYNWVFVCISLIEHTRKMRENAEGNVLVSAGEGGGASNRGSPSSRPTSGGTKKA